MAIVEPPAPGMRWETRSEHIARDMEEGRFPQQSERKQVPDHDVKHTAPAWKCAMCGKEAVGLTSSQAEIARLREALTIIHERLESAFGAGVWDLPSPNPNGPSRLDHQNAALFSIISTCKAALK